MIRYTLRISAIAATLLLTNGCLPQISSPIGKLWESGDVAALEGLWVAENGDHVLATHHGGVLYVPNQAFNTKSLVFEVRTIEVTPRMIDSVRLLFFKSKDESDPYSFVLVETEADGRISLRLPSAEFFKDAVKTSKLRGKVIQSTISADTQWAMLEPDESGFRALLQTAKLDDMFPASTKVSLRRISKSRHEKPNVPGHFDE